MRGARLMLTTVARGFVFLAACLVVQAGHGDHEDWGVQYTTNHICAPAKSTVTMNCTYKYPFKEIERKVTVSVTDIIWFKKNIDQHYHNLSAEPEYKGRVTYHCVDKRCSLTVKDLVKADTGSYKFRFETTHERKAYSGVPGVSLSVTALQIHIQMTEPNEVELFCNSTCNIRDNVLYIWYKNETVVGEGQSQKATFGSGDIYKCAIKNHEQYPSRPVYAPRLLSMEVTHNGQILEGTSVTLNCHTNATPTAEHTLYKDDEIKEISRGMSHQFQPIKSSDSGRYFCRAENGLGNTKGSIFIDVKYPPRVPSLSVSPSAEMVEGSSVTLTCSSDANPAANITWYKEKQILFQGAEGVYRFPSIRPEDGGFYYCKCQNEYGQNKSESLHIDVQYPPKNILVSVSPSAEMVEGNSVNLSCSSDANPAADYTWYKEGEDSPKASGQIFTITDLRPEHSGNYYCVAKNTRGPGSSLFNKTALMVSREAWKSVAIGTILALLFAIILLSIFQLIKIQRTKPSCDHEERPNQSGPGRGRGSMDSSEIWD
ncbi:B-cell receptor CD22-like isoform X2 [Echeneis naucrates]|uniref:B-cell receptor CD22-like isoform X2 n=1 Tax=Echeneis naucrates TaxID=173247 RepID=UPI001114145C|nr:B-cell receptor CD22-like isoform X2 [Echeneis naucrates]XP_029354677.1 B-cell receptor CD22-like isoform X2 [Echeneis naucrates]